MDLIIKNAQVVTPIDVFNADVGIKGEKIAAVARDINTEGARIIDAAGKFLFPGVIDVHTHFQLPFQGAVSGDDFENGTKAGACGGVTTIIDFAIQTKGRSIFEAIENRRAQADGKVHIDYALHCGPTDFTPETLAAIPKIIEMGIPSFKVFMTYRKEGMIMEDGALFAILREAKKHNALVGVHAENTYILEYLIEEAVNAGTLAPIYHARTRPNFVEAECISRGIRWAEETGSKFYVFHVSTRQGVYEIFEARHRGVPVYGETCPSYLFLTEDNYLEPDGQKYTLTPPLRSKADQEVLWKALRDGVLQVVSTDHCPFQLEEKAWGKDDFRKTPNGLPGVETTLPLLFSEGVNKGRLTPQHLAAMLSYSPAVIFGLYPDKGRIAPGADADLVLVDPDKEVVLSHKNLHMKVNYNPLEGLALKGYPVMTLSRGEVIYQDGEYLGKAGRGKFIKRKLS